MGLFSHKDKKGAGGPPSPQYFVVYGLSAGKHGVFREEFDHAFGRKSNASLTFSRPPQKVASGYAAADPDDQYLTITPREGFDGDDGGRAAQAVHEAKVVEAVRTATRKAGGSSMTPVR